MMTNQNQVQQAPQFQTTLAKVNNTFLPMIESQFTNNNIQMDDYQKSCVLNAMTAINQTLDAKAISINDPDFDRNNLTDILLKVAALKLNASATPREVFFSIRNVNKKAAYGGKDNWMKQIEMGIEGDGNDALVSNFGRGVKTVHPHWEVREHDEFIYPKHRGIEISPPEWAPTGQGKVIRVVYPITMENGITNYYIAERADVIKNLIAHINQNLMNETFGRGDKKNLKGKAKDEVEAEKAKIIEHVKSIGLDAALEQLDGPHAQFISPAWKSEQSRESMIVRKMRNNITKKIPKDFGNAFIATQFEEATDEEFVRVRKDITEQANQIPLSIPNAPQSEVIEPEPVLAQQPSKPFNAQTGEIIDAPQPEQVPVTPHVERPDMYQKAQDETLFTQPTQFGDNEEF